jgi:hypothetical protein
VETSGFSGRRAGPSGRCTEGARVIGSHGECGSGGGGGRSKCRVGWAPEDGVKSIIGRREE